MSPPAPTAPRGLVGWPVLLLAASVILLTTVGGGLFPWGALLGLIGVAFSAVWRAGDDRPTALLPFLPVLTSLAVIVIASVPGVLTDLYAGLVGLSLLLWIGDDPSHSPGGLGRGSRAVALTGVALTVAWAVSLVRIPTGAGLGIAVALLCVALLLLAVLLTRLPHSAEREPPSPDEHNYLVQHHVPPLPGEGPAPGPDRARGPAR